MPNVVLFGPTLDTTSFRWIQPLRFDVYSQRLENIRPVWFQEGTTDTSIHVRDGNNQGLYVVRPEDIYRENTPSGRGMNIDQHGLEHTLIMVGNSRHRVREYCGDKSEDYLEFFHEDLLPELRKYVPIPKRIIGLGSSAGGSNALLALALGYVDKAVAIGVCTRGEGIRLEQLFREQECGGRAYIDTTDGFGEPPFDTVHTLTDLLARRAETVVAFVKGNHNEESQSMRVPAGMAAVEGATYPAVHALISDQTRPWFVGEYGPHERLPPLEAFQDAFHV